MRHKQISFALLAWCLMPAHGSASSSLGGHWVAEQDADFVLNVDGGAVGGHYWCRHTFLSIRGEISGDGNVEAWASEVGVPSYKAKITGRLPTLMIVHQDLCPGERTMHKE